MLDFKAFIITDIVTIGVIILFCVIVAIITSRNSKKSKQKAFVPDNRYAVSNNLDEKYDVTKSRLQLLFDGVCLEFREITLIPLLLEDHGDDDIRKLLEIVETLAYVNAESTEEAESAASRAKFLCTCEAFGRYFPFRAMKDMETLSDIMTDICWLEKYPLETAISISENSTGNVIACYRTESGESVQHGFRALHYRKNFFKEGVCCDVYFPGSPEENSLYSYVLDESIKDETSLSEIRNRATHEIAYTHGMTSYIIFEYCVKAATKD